MNNEATDGGATVPCISLLAEIVDELLSHIDYHDNRVPPPQRVTGQVQILAWRRRKEAALANSVISVKNEDRSAAT